MVRGGAEKFKEGLRVWKTLMDDFPTYRDDELSKKETGQIVKRYKRVLQQNLTPIPDDLPFKQYLPLIEHDTTVDPFDTLEMIGVVGDPGAKAPAPGPAPAPGSNPAPGVPTAPKS